ncbi:MULTISPECIES: hypothetical protein [Acinetobacter]|uniref:hypothetical protein n=1 Tax=Acinetobacter TaxID=469 RepID=UPI0013EEC5EB|nr:MULTISPECIES: hypothetical protein [Acinetobacter]
MKNQIKPDDASHIETDGTYWKNEKGIWMWWRTGWGWCHFVGVVNKRLLDKFTPL